MTPFKNPFMKSVCVVGTSRVEVLFENSEKRVFDLEPYLELPAFRTLRDPHLFDKVQVDSGWALSWPGDIDLSHDTIYLEGKAVSHLENYAHHLQSV
ncbi:MAG: DUF2442 domain-containing protein [Verrucomicrobiae bacterium]